MDFLGEKKFNKIDEYLVKFFLKKDLVFINRNEKRVIVIDIIKINKKIVLC